MVRGSSQGATPSALHAAPGSPPLGPVSPSTGGPRLTRVGSPAASGDPGPVGISDLGTDPSGGTLGLSTTSFEGTVSIAAVSSYNASLGPDADWMSVQLNTFLEFSSSAGTSVYWAQDVAELNTSTGALEIFDNIWNATSTPYPALSSSSVRGNGTVTTFGPESYYGDGASCSYADLCGGRVSAFTLLENVSVGGGVPVIRFGFDAGSGTTIYDTVSFPFATSLSGTPHLVVDANLYSPFSCARCYGDAELVAGGPDDGYNTTLTGSTAVDLGLEAWNGFNYEAVPAAYNYGISTAEGLADASSTASPGPGVPVAVLANGTEARGALWGSGGIARVAVSVDTGHAGGTISVNGGSTGFAGTTVAVELVPGTYSLAVVSGGTTYPLGSVVLTAGEQLTLEVGLPAVVFVESGLPAETDWSVTLNGVSLNGTGNLTFGAASGNYTFVIGSVSGYRPSPSSGSVIVPSNGTEVLVAWQSVPPGFLASLEGLLDRYWLPLLIVAIAVIVVLAVLANPRAPRRAVANPAFPGTAAQPPPGGQYSGPMRTCPYCGYVQPVAYAACLRCRRRIADFRW